MDQPTTSVSIEIKAADLVDLEEWARNSEQTVQDLLQEALRHYLDYVRADHAELERRLQGPSYTLEEVKQHLAERRRHLRTQAAE
jgi:predicted transcriptional regulator